MSVISEQHTSDHAILTYDPWLVEFKAKAAEDLENVEGQDIVLPRMLYVAVVHMGNFHSVPYSRSSSV